MDDTVKKLDEPPTKPHVLPALPTELWLTIFEHVVTYDTHIFDQSLQYRRERTHDLQKLQYVCRSWRDMIKPVVYRHIALNGNGGHPGPKGNCGLAADYVTALACLLDQTTDSGTPEASWVRSFWIQRDGREKGTRPALTSLQEALPDLISRMTNLSELCCRVVLHGPQIASIAHSHGSQLTKLAVKFGGHIDIPEVLPLLKHFTALTDIHLGVHGWTGKSYSIEPPDLPNLRLLQTVTEFATDELLAWFTQWNMPMLSAFACLTPYDCIRTVRPELSVLTAFMAKHGAGLRTVTFDDTNPTIAVFPYTPSLNIYKTFSMRDVLEGLPGSVTQIVLCGIGENLGYQVRILRWLLQTVQLLPPEKKLHTIRMVSDNKYLGGAPFIWREKMQQADTRRVDTWKEFKNNAKGLLELGVPILDEQDVALTDVLEEMEPSQESICMKLVESATDTLLGSDQ